MSWKAALLVSAPSAGTFRTMAKIYREDLSSLDWADLYEKRASFLDDGMSLEEVRRLERGAEAFEKATTEVAP